MALADLIDNRHLQLLDQARLLSLVGKLRQTLIKGYRDSPLALPGSEHQVEAEPAATVATARKTSLTLSNSLSSPGRIRQ
jgi:hypothetical protein